MVAQSSRRLVLALAAMVVLAPTVNADTTCVKCWYADTVEANRIINEKWDSVEVRTGVITWPDSNGVRRWGPYYGHRLAYLGEDLPQSIDLQRDDYGVRVRLAWLRFYVDLKDGTICVVRCQECILEERSFIAR